ncbi:MarR family winged helix-turn-helix transcriptional regulator [Breoghania sp. L-A4]|uniref:MarR family winged helix-turn-helix transcriptional regulator n=1 Tax=Breoghania sp. L-A4 TaxID=2304600 RepID=UPI000E358131|nr:MarR family winged helix-turn-helix transcriptional regulator [Breoghania sp. L-A4]AXS40812.1 MarR family transcriptional regulator [Breoghania sp. L-A4]
MTAFDLAHFLPYRLSVLAARVSADFAAVYARRFDLSVPEWRVLAHLAQGGDVSVREIHARVDMDKSKVSRAAQRLELRGLVSKAAHPRDKRLVSLSLTDAGQALMAEIAPLALGFEAALLEKLPPAERAALVHAIDILVKPA